MTSQTFPSLQFAFQINISLCITPLITAKDYSQGIPKDLSKRWSKLSQDPCHLTQRFSHGTDRTDRPGHVSIKQVWTNPTRTELSPSSNATIMNTTKWIVNPEFGWNRSPVRTSACCSVKLHYTTASLRYDRPLVAMSGSTRDQRDDAKNEREDDLPLNLMTPLIICQAAQHNRP